MVIGVCQAAYLADGQVSHIYSRAARRDSDGSKLFALS